MACLEKCYNQVLSGDHKGTYGLQIPKYLPYTQTQCTLQPVSPYQVQSASSWAPLMDWVHLAVPMFLCRNLPNRPLNTMYFILPLPFRIHNNSAENDCVQRALRDPDPAYKNMISLQPEEERPATVSPRCSMLTCVVFDLIRRDVEQPQTMCYDT